MMPPPDLETLGLHSKGFFLLAAIEQTPFPAELARIMSLPSPTVTYIIKQLEEKRFVRRKIEPGDLRKFRLLLTASGKRAVLQGKEKINEVFGERLARLSQKDIDLFNQLVGRLAQEEHVSAGEAEGTGRAAE